MNEFLPDGMTLVARNDRSGIYKQRLNLMLKNAQQNFLR